MQLDSQLSPLWPRLCSLQAWGDMSIPSTTGLFDIALYTKEFPNMTVVKTVNMTKAFLGKNRERLTQQVAELEVAVRDMGRVSAGEAEKAGAAEGVLLATRSELLAARREALRTAIASVTAVGVPV